MMEEEVDWCLFYKVAVEVVEASLYLEVGAVEVT